MLRLLADLPQIVLLSELDSTGVAELEAILSDHLTIHICNCAR